MSKWISISMLLVLLATGIGCTERVNKSVSLGPFWSTAKEEGDLLTWKLESDGDLIDRPEEHQLDDSFSSLDGILQWAIGHSDPAKLKQTVQSIRGRSPDELKQLQLEIKKLEMPSDAQLMKIAIDDLNNLSMPLEDRHHALQELLILVEPMDNANDLHKLGGLTAVIGELYNPDPEIRTISAWILGKASQNNPVVGKQILDLGTLAKLMEMASSNFIEEASKALYTISALIRNNLEGQELFYMEGGDLMLQNILSNSSIDIRLRRKSVLLVTDLVEHHLDCKDKELPFFSNHFFLMSVVGLMASSDLDLQEKALYAVKNLLLLRSANAIVFKEVCELDVALRRMRQQLQQLMVDEKFEEYTLDMESLRGEVEHIFLAKLDKKYIGRPEELIVYALKHYTADIACQ